MRHQHTPILNVTPHALTFACDECPGGAYNVAPCGVVLSAVPQETVAGEGPGGVTLVCTTFTAAPEMLATLDSLEATYPGHVIVGSIIAAQAFPGRVMGMASAPGFERVAPDEKRMDPEKFIVFRQSIDDETTDQGEEDTHKEPRPGRRQRPSREDDSIVI